MWPPFNPEIFVAKKNGKWGYINRYGKNIIPFIYDDVTYFESQSNLALVSKGNYPNSKYGFIDKKGNIIIPLKYSNAIFFINGFAWVNENGISYYIDKNGKSFFKNFKFDYDYNGFHDNRSAFKLNNKFGFIDTNGEIIIPPKYDEIRNFNDGEKICQVKVNGKWGAININGEYILKPDYDYVSSFNEKIGYCIKDGKYLVVK